MPHLVRNQLESLGELPIPGPQIGQSLQRSSASADMMLEQRANAKSTINVNRSAPAPTIIREQSDSMVDQNDYVH